MEILLYMSDNVDTWYKIVLLFVQCEDLSKITYKFDHPLVCIKSQANPPPKKKDKTKKKKPTNPPPKKTTNKTKQGQCIWDK